MQSFTTERGIVAPLNRANVDTDQIIPKQFLKSIRRTGFEEGLFFDWSKNEDGSSNADFELNQSRFAGASILVAGNNFGCGSSREHAVWAVMQGGFNAVIAPWTGEGNKRVPAFADIFKNNSSKNGLLTVELPLEDVNRIFEAIETVEGLEATIDLATQTLTVHTPDAMTFSFDIDPSVKQNLLRGLDDIALTLEHEASITTFESGHDTQIASA